MDWLSSEPTWDAGSAFKTGATFEMVCSVCIMVAASIFIYRAWDGPVFVIRINMLIFLVGLSLFLLDLFNFILNGPLMTIFAFSYYILDLSTYWLFAFKYYTASSKMDAILA